MLIQKPCDDARPRKRGRRAAIALGVLLATACGDAPDVVGQGRWLALDLAGDSSSGAGNETLRVRADDPLLRVVRGEGSFVEGAPIGAANRVLELAGEGARLVEVSGDAASRADLVRLRAAAVGTVAEPVRVSVFVDGHDRAYSSIVQVEGGELREYVFDLAEARRFSPTGEGVLLLQLGGLAERVRVESVTLEIRGPIGGLASETGLLDLGGDARRGVILFPDDPRAAVVPDGWSGEVAFSCAVGPRLEGTLDCRVGQTTHRLELHAAEQQWVEVQYPCEAGDRITWSTHSALGAAVGDVGLRRSAPSERRSVVLVTSDTHRADHQSLVGARLARTPGLEALAANAVVYTDVLAPSNATNPSHVSLMTGLNVTDHRVLNNRTPITGEALTLAEAFRARGWRTMAAVSAFHLSDGMSGLGQGFDRFSYPSDLSSAEAGTRTATETVDVLESWLDLVSDEPTFIWLHVFDAHTPYLPPPEFDRSYYPSDRDPREYGPGLRVAAGRVPRFLSGVKDPEFPAAQYKALVSYLDHELRRIWNAPSLESAVKVFTSDHGESLGERGIWWTHDGLYPGTTQVPLLIAAPEIQPRVESLPVATVGLGTTLLELAGVDERAWPIGARVTLAGAAQTPEPRFALGAWGDSALVDHEGWRLILHLEEHTLGSPPQLKERGRVELFDMTTDPGCLDDRIEDEWERASRMRDALLRWLRAEPAQRIAGSLEPSADVVELLEGLGYAGGANSDGAGSLYPNDGPDWFDRERAR